MTMDEALLARVQRLEDIEEIRILKSRYAAFCDDNYDSEGIASLFTKNGIWDGGDMGRYEGREAIRDFFSGTPGVVPFAIHHVTNPLIEIDGDSASGRWYLWQPCVFSEGDQAMWMAGTYYDRYRREAGAWLFEDVRIELRMLSPYEAGFAKNLMVEFAL